MFMLQTTWRDCRDLMVRTYEFSYAFNEPVSLVMSNLLPAVKQTRSLLHVPQDVEVKMRQWVSSHSRH